MQALQALFPPNDFILLAVIVALPLLGAIINGIFGKRLGKDAVRLMALSSIGASFILSVVQFLLLSAAQTEDSAAHFRWLGWRWLSLSEIGEAGFLNSGAGAGGIPIEVAFSVDALSGTMALIVTGVGFLIHLYSTSYMEHDKGFHRFFCYLNLFIFAMLVLILGDSLPVLFVGWEGVGLCSYLLIGFWFEGSANASAGKKAFIVNRIGDFGLLVAMALLVKYTGALDWAGIESGSAGLNSMVRVWHAPFLPAGYNEPVYVSAATLVGLSAFLGCAGKSAQIPLYVWLPDAMAGPTPVSALIHAATMVTAGVYLVCRMAPVFVMSPFAMMTVATIGALTAVFAATIALVQNDIKKVLAYSTVSQLGYMFLGVGVGAFSAGFFHVITHAFFKACLFLGAGSVIHSMHARIHDTDASQDMRNMGGMRRFMPLTNITFFVSCFAIAGLPLTSGFFSKDEILYKAFTSQVITTNTNMIGWWAPLNTILFALGVLGAIMTAFYMFRLYFVTFWGSFRGWRIVKGWTDPGHGHDQHHHEQPGESMSGPTPHESPWQMTLPLLVLGALAAFGGFLNAHILHLTPFEHWLEPLFAGNSSVSSSLNNLDPHHELVIPLLVPGVLAFLIGSGVAYWMYVARAGKPAGELAAKNKKLHQLLLDKWRIDELYDEYVVGTLETLAELSVRCDKWVVDGIIAKLTSWVVALFGHVLRLLQTGQAHTYAAYMMVGVVGLGWFLTAPHPQIVGNGPKSSGAFQCVDNTCVASAASGLGYAYRWDLDGDGKFDADDFGNQHEVSFSLTPGQTRTIQLEVKNAFGRTSSQSFDFTQPQRDRSSPSAALVPAALNPASLGTTPAGDADREEEL